MKNKNFEREIPSGYFESKHIDAKDKKFGIIFNLIALFIAAAVFLIAYIIVAPTVKNMTHEWDSADPLQIAMPVGLIIGAVLFFAYIILHELVHGAVYKRMTGEKLAFGITWSAAFCGVPDIYVYRRTAIFACVAPLVLFSAILIPSGITMLVLASLFSSAWALAGYVAVTFVFAFHLGGCAGDIYAILLLLIRFKNKKTLMRDTGPEQWFYSPSLENDGNSAPDD